MDSVFAQLTRGYNNRKYGQTEIEKIKELITKEIAVVYTYHQVDASVPCFSIMVGSDGEDARRDHLGDHYEEVTEDLQGAELDALNRVENLVVTAYDPVTGKVTCHPSTDLSMIYKYMIYVDAADIEHELTGGISNATNDKFFFINKNSDVDFSSFGLIKSSLNYKQYEVKGVTGNVQLVVGAHSKDALTTKYLYILLKYFILSRKNDMIKRCFYLAMYSGSDFNRDSQYVGDQVYTRFLTVSGKVDDTWRSDQVVLIDNVEIVATPVDD